MKNAIIRLYRQFPVTTIFILTATAVSILTGFGSFKTLYWFIFDPTLIQQGQIWRIITPIFLHFPIMGVFFAHLAFNLIWFYQFGSLIERADSSKFLLTLVLVSGIVSNLCEAFFTPHVIFGGMSGVVYALLGYLWLRKKLSPNYPVQLPDKIVYFLLFFLVLSFTGFLGSIANYAHLSGLITGIFFAVIKSTQIRRL